MGKTKKRTPIGVLENTMVGDTRFELVTPAVSRQCSPPELTAHFSVVAATFVPASEYINRVMESVHP